MIFIAILFYIYCIVGAIVGVVCWMDEKWPKYMKDDSALLDGNATIGFFFCCGPFFWIVGLFFIVFRFIVGLLKKEV